MSRLARLLPLASLLLLTACPDDGTGEDPDAGTDVIPDQCNSQEEARTLAECELALGQQVERHISFPGDQDWYSVRMPPTANARTLVRVTAGYLAQSTAVNLSVNLLRDSDQTALARQVDNHGQGAPRPVEIIIPFTEPNARLLLLLGDEPTVPSRPQFDAKSPYFVKVEVLDNPDTNEPNNSPTQATPLTLNPQGPVLVGTSMGYLATAGDVDVFTFTAAANKVAYVRLTAPELRPAAAYRLSYELKRPDGTNEAEGRVPNATIATDLATARKLKTAGTWTVVIQGYKPAGDTSTVPGDLRQQYSLEVRLLDEQDPQDFSGDNDSVANALVRTIGAAPGSSTTFNGRIGYVPDPDWYAVDVPASSSPTVLTFRMVQGAGGGRFPALPGFLDRQVRAFTFVTKGAVLADWRQNCVADPTACPKGYAEAPGAQSLVESYCNTGPTAMCLHSSREEEAQNFPNLRNFEGAIPVPPHATQVRYYFVVQDDGNNWADDRDYTLQVSWQDDADDSARYSGGVEVASSQALAADPSGSTYPAPPAGATALNGQLTHGFGRLRDQDRITGRGVRGPADYDAVPSDTDSYILTLPSTLADPKDRTWAIQWQVQNLPDGGMPHGLALDLTFCDGDRLDGGACTPVNRGSRGAPLTLAYRDEALRAWYSAPGTLSGLQPLYSRQMSGGTTTFTVLPYACSCLEPRFIRGGTMRVDVSATERTSYERVNYSVRTAYTDYPKNYGVDGGSNSCPAPTQDGGTWVPGCRFTLQP
jgi:hypothetical protein